DRERRGHDPLVAERLDYQADGVGIRRGLRMHLHVVEVETGECVQVTSGDLDTGGPTWAPDGKELAFAAVTARDRDLVFRAPLYRAAADGKSDPQLVAFADSAVLGACWTPDGTGILAVAMDPEKGFSAHAHLFRV